MPYPIECQAIDTQRHHYLKVSIDDLNMLGIIPLITPYSFVGCDEDDPMNEYKYAYLETDCDWGYLIKAAEFLKYEVEIDYKTLQEIYDERYEDHHDRVDEMGSFDEESIADYWNMEIKQPSQELKDFVYKSDDDYDEEEDEEDGDTDN